jgi:hypothetical protein
MRKSLPLLVCAILLITSLNSCKNSNDVRINPLTAMEVDEDENEENEEYDGPAQADEAEFLKTKDPVLGYIPGERLINAIEYTQNLKNGYANYRFGLLWNERGPVFDSVGPTNGKTRGGGGYTSGRMRAILVDTLNDKTGNTVIVGGVAGGVWRTTNFLSTNPNWQNASDFFNNLAISSICQDPGTPSIIYFSTGEPVANADAVVGAGIWKSVDAGITWSRLPATASAFGRTFKLACDASGNLYVASRSTTAPFASTSGLYRSNDKGGSFTNITPNNLTSINAICTDIEITSTGKLQASFGYNTGGTSSINHRYTSTPATVTSSTWNSGAGIRLSGVSAIRFEMSALADTVYGVTINSGGNIDSCYKSTDGGANWVKQNTTIYAAGLTNTQGWYNATLAVNPDNSAEFITGGLDAYRSTNSGQTIAIATNWVTGLPYVHADHHNMQWMKVNGESRIIIGCDGGIFLSRDGGLTWRDKNYGLGIKQFYAADIHPAAGSNYLIAGAQDNGTHQITTPGLTYSKEVVGGDGMFCHINQQNPLVQYAAYTGNQYRRSLDGGQTWSGTGVSFSGGMFVNPWDYDDSKNVLYGNFAAGSIFRMTGANAATPAATALTIPQFGTGTAAATPSAFKVSPYTSDRVYIGASFPGGTSTGTTKLVRLDNASTGAPVVTTLNVASFPTTAFLNCVNTGSDDNNLVVAFSNYGVSNIWISKDGGASWTAVDGNLPDMPVRWAMFLPGNDNKMMIATETGVFTTDALNGAGTNWEASSSFPIVRTDMIKLRASDNTVVAATHGRGLFTAQLPGNTQPLINFASASTSVSEDSTGTNCRRYRDYIINVGILNPPTGDATITLSVQAGNTATAGNDFDFTTNGSFTSPSAQLTFKSGDATVQPVTVRIYDDAEIESTETFTLGYAISGTTNAQKGTTSAHTFTIIDNDVAPVAKGAANISVGTYNSDLSSLNTPFDGTKLKHRLQVIFTAGELKAAGFTSPGPINSLTLRVKTKNTTKPFNGFTVSIGHTGYTGLNTGFVPEFLNPVFNANYSTVAGNNTFNFTTPFYWNGNNNIVVQFCYDNTGGTAETVTDVVEGNLSPLGVYRASTFSNYTTSGSAGCALAAALVDYARVNAVFATSLGNPVATVLNSTRTEYLNSNNDIYYFTTSGEIMGRIKNLSAHNYGCTEMTIDRAGKLTTPFWNFNPANFFMEKTFRVTPTTNNTTGKYEITFYYSKEEKESWEALTGQSWNNIMIAKLPSAVNKVTPLNAQPDGPGTIQFITPVRGTFGTGYTLTASVDNGFSGFGAGIPGRINTILTLNAQLNSNQKDINVNWNTSAEMTTATFELEKSYDGSVFHKISTVNAAGTKLSPSTYSYVDGEYVQYNYYRVKMIYTDGSFLYSNTVFVEINNVPQRYTVMGNPFGGQVSIRFSRAPLTKVQFEIFDMSGRLVAKYNRNGGAILYSINTSNIISAGIYRLQVKADYEFKWFTILKQ